MTVQQLTYGSSPTPPAIKDEPAALYHFIKVATAHGLGCDRQALTHVFVTFKAHASILLVGPANSGKIALVRAIDQTLGDEAKDHLQMLVGHARWASAARNTSFLSKCRAGSMTIRFSLSWSKQAGKKTAADYSLPA